MPFNSPLILLLFLLTPPSPVPDAAGLVPLKIQAAPPIFDRRIDTKLRRDPAIDQPDSRAKPLMVPAGTINLAYEMPVTSSDKDPIIGHLGLITDGDNLGTEGGEVELVGGQQWIQIDLLESSPVSAIAFWHFCAGDRVYHDIIIQTCDRPDFTRDVKTLFNNDVDNSSHLGKGTDREYLESELGKIIPVKDTRARYIRFYSRGSTADELNHYVEAAVYGQPGPAQREFRELRKNRHSSVNAFLKFLESREPGSIRRQANNVVAITAAIEEPCDLSFLNKIPTLTEWTILPGGNWGYWNDSDKSFPNLRRLDIQDNNAVYFFLNRDLPNVESLSLGVRSREVQALIRALPSLKKLQSLRIVFLPTDHLDLTILRKLTMLKSLDLSGCDMGDELTAEIKTLTSLRELDFSNNKITSAAMIDLKSLKALKSLNLARTKVGDSILSDLPELPNLATLNLSHTLATESAIESARKKFPRLKIQFDEGADKDVAR